MIPAVPREQILQAMARFDRELRDSPEWADWQEQGNTRYAITVEGKLYPVKQIIVLATGTERSAFKGGSEANGYVEARGFKVTPIDRQLESTTPSKIAYDTARLDPLSTIFKQRFPSFTSQEYLDAERTYKRMAAERMQKLIGRAVLREYIEQRQFEEAKAAIIKSGQGSFKISATISQPNNLLNQWDLIALQEAPAEQLVLRLYDLLYGDAPFAQRFDAWVALLAEKKPGVWPTATYFLMLLDPNAYIFIKPTQYQFFFKSVGLDEPWPTRPTAAAYARYLDLAQQLLADLQPLGAQDLIDVQSFLWSVPYYAQHSAWIFQSNPKQYDLPGALAAFDQISWLVRQNDTNIKAGDTVYLWESGDNAGIVAVALTLAEPRDLPPDQLDRQFYRDGRKLDAVQPRVPLQIELVLPQRITRDELLAEPTLKNMAILQQPRGTNFKVSDAEATTLASMIEKYMSAPIDSLEEWQNSIPTTNKPLVRKIIMDYPEWIQTTFGKQVEFRAYAQPSFGVAVKNVRLQFCQFTREDNISVELYNASENERQLIREQLSAPQTISDKPFFFSFRVNTDADYQLLKSVTKHMVNRVLGGTPELQEMTGVEAGLSGNAQIRIALQEMVDRGGSSTVPQIYAAVEAQMNGHKLSQQGQDSLRSFINKTAVDRGYVYPYDGSTPIWRITDAGRALLASNDDHLWPPDSLDGPLFVLTHKNNDDCQRYGETYCFTVAAGGSARRLHEAAQSVYDGGPPFHVIVYRTSPIVSFTAWATVSRVSKGRSDAQDGWTLHLDHHEFPVPVDAHSLMSKIDWLAAGLAKAFRQRSIREVNPHDFSMIIAAAREAEGTPMIPSDAAFAVLSQAGGGPLSLADIYERARQRSLLGAQVSQRDLATALQHDGARFTARGSDMWALAATSQFEFGPETAFWRLHFPREYWPEAHQNNLIAVGFNDNPMDQSMKRFRRIKPGDRIVAYVQGGTIGSVGVVTQPYRDDQQPTGAAARLFGGTYRRHLGVAWADAPDAPVSLLEQLRDPAYTTLYNRLKNPQTVIPLSRDDYVNILTLLEIDDVGTPISETRLPALWLQLDSYAAFVQSLAARDYSAAELDQLARAHADPAASLLDLDAMIEDLRCLRVLEAVADDRYLVRPYVPGQRAALLRLMAMALLVPIEGSAETYELPSRAIIKRIQEATGPQPLDSFAPELGADRQRLLEWYHAAGLVVIDETSSTWQPSEQALGTLAGDDEATRTYNQFLATLLAETAGTLRADLDPVAGALPPAAKLAERLRELSLDLLVDERIVRRIYRSLMAGRHVVLSGPPGTGKTELASRLPSLLWREDAETLTRITTRLDDTPVISQLEQRHGYAAIVVTATEDWGVRDIVGGIGPQLDGDNGLGYTIQHGALTRAVLQHYDGTDQGRRLPTQPHAPTRRDYQHEDRRRYRGAWLVIDEFTRAPVDAAFGSLLTTLSGGDSALLAVPTPSGEQRDVPVPPDFRIIGTLNSFDRHFLNQISEALKRRFDFIDVLPPPPQYAEAEQGIAAKRALRRLHDNGFSQIQVAGEPPIYRLGNLLAVEPLFQDGWQHYQLVLPDSSVAALALRSFWRIFSAIRVFRQLGTAQ
ncbi:MAG: EVE domain-containing protein, partial [Chloroflexota bacterium]|nr:EVE domain-containing protein [Chloroflexota bacterium]